MSRHNQDFSSLILRFDRDKARRNDKLGQRGEEKSVSIENAAEDVGWSRVTSDSHAKSVTYGFGR